MATKYPAFHIVRYRFQLLLLGLFGLTACESYFLPELDDFEAVLVLDGGINSLPGPYTITLSSSAGIRESDQNPVEGAVVVIQEEGGEEETLTEVEPGTYITAVNGIQGTPGKSYRVSIRLRNGKQYESDFQEMPPALAIDSIGADLEYQYISLEEPDVPGFQFHVTTETAEVQENFLLWSMESTFKYKADFTIDYLYFNRSIYPYANPTEFSTCWRTDPIRQIFTFNTQLLSAPKVERLPLHFARADQRELSIRYSLLVKQFSLTESGYQYWNNLQRQIESQESLYNTQPFQIRGNLYNVNDSDEAVLGFFMVAGLDEQRIFIDHPDELGLSYSYCEPDYFGYNFIGLIHPANWPIYIYEDETGARALSNDECFDCRELGGTTTKAAFWED